MVLNIANLLLVLVKQMFEVMAKLLFNKQIKFDDGRLVLLGIRDSFTPLDTYLEFQKIMFKSGKEKLIYDSAKVAGFNWFKKMSELFPGITQNKASNWGIDLIALSGWGIPEIEKIDFKNKYAVFILKNSTVARGFGSSEKPVDCLFAGLLAGGMSFSLKEDLDAIETHCLAKGDKECKFVVSKLINDK